MTDYRSRRFLIDAIDERLGSVEKEKKFDICMIVLGIALICGGVIIAVSLSQAYPKIIILSLILSMMGVALSYVMTKEYIADWKKQRYSRIYGTKDNT